MHQVVMPDWVLERGASRLVHDRLSPARTALVVVDMQVFFLSEGQAMANPHALDIVANVNRLAAAVRRAGGRVVFLQHTVSEAPLYALPAWQFPDPSLRRLIHEGLSPGAPGHRLHPDIEVRPGDKLVRKHRPSAFLPNSSTLHRRLRRLGVDTLAVTGTVTNVCCESTARDAHMLDYQVLVVSDATAALNDELHNASLTALRLHFADVVSTDELIARLPAPAGPLQESP